MRIEKNYTFAVSNNQGDDNPNYQQHNINYKTMEKLEEFRKRLIMHIKVNKEMAEWSKTNDPENVKTWLYRTYEAEYILHLLKIVTEE